MITSKYIVNICDEYSGMKKMGHQMVNIYVNPSLGDLKDMAADARKQSRTLKDIRFIASDDPPKVYVWDPFIAIHKDIASLYSLDLNSTNVMHGIISISGGKAVATYQDFQDAVGRRTGNAKDFYSHNWHFLSNYFGLNFSKFLRSWCGPSYFTK